jgi:hypothetical protein
MSYDNVKSYPKQTSEIPNERHFAVFINDQFSYDDGYGSKGNPSLSTYYGLKYLVIESEAALRKWIIANRTRYPEFKIFVISPVSYTETITIDIKEAL